MPKMKRKDEDEPLLPKLNGTLNKWYFRSERHLEYRIRGIVNGANCFSLRENAVLRSNIFKSKETPRKYHKKGDLLYIKTEYGPVVKIVLGDKHPNA